MKTPKLTELSAREIIDLDFEAIEAEGDSDKMGATITIIRAGISKNNRNYRVEALKQAAKEKLFDGVRMFIDHSTKLPTTRKFTEMVSAIDSTWYDEKSTSLKGKVEFFNKDFYDYAQRAKKHMGASIDSTLRGVVIPQVGGRALEDIYGFVQPRSVDWVLYPAAGGGIDAFESQEGDDVDWATLTEEMVKEHNPSLYAKMKAQVEPSQGIGAASQHEGEEDEKVLLGKEQVQEIVKEALTTYQKEQENIKAKQEAAAADVRAAFTNSGLPPKTQARVMAGFEGITEFDAAKVTSAIDSAKEELKAAGAGPAIKGVGSSTSGEGEKDEKPVFSAHESVSKLFAGPSAVKVGTSGDDPKEGDK